MNTVVYDEEPDILEAGEYIVSRCRFFARLGVQASYYKGNLLIHACCGYYSVIHPMHSLLFPGEVLIRFPKFLTLIDEFYGDLVRLTRIYKPIHWYQTKVFKFFWKRAAKKYPHIRKEILHYYDDVFS